MESGEYDRHIVRMRRRHLQRQEVLTRALATHFGNAVQLTGGSGGNHLLVWPDRLTERNLKSLVMDCAGRGVGIYPLSLYAVRPLKRPGILLGYGGIEAEQIERGIRAIARAFEGIVSSAK